MVVKINPISIFRANVYFIAFILGANIIGIICNSYFDEKYIEVLADSFDFDTEGNIPTFYSALALLAASGLLLLIASNCKRLKLPHVLWFVLSAIFLFLSVDEFDSIHEIFTRRSRDFFSTSGFLYYAWVIPYGAAVAVFVVVYSSFLLRLPKRTMRLFIISGALYVSGAIGFELIGGKHDELYGSKNLMYSIYYTCEELLEMFGIALFIYALLNYIVDNFENLRIEFTSSMPTKGKPTVVRELEIRS